MANSALRGNLKVSIHASVMEATIGPGRGFDVQRRFDPRLRDGGDMRRVRRRSCGSVSIHASVMEATLPLRGAVRVCRVSIHASVMEATFRGYLPAQSALFRSTPP